MKGDQIMYNTLVQGRESNNSNSNRSRSKRKRFQMNQNFSGLQLNPWNDQPSQSYPYLEVQHIFSSPKISSNVQSVYRQFSQKHSQKNSNNKFTNTNKRVRQTQKDQFFFNRQKRIRSTVKEQQISMNKTVSVHNFSGEKVFNRLNIVERRKSLSIEKKRDSRKTIISNPMFMKFCNKFLSDRQKLLLQKAKPSLSHNDRKSLDDQKSANTIKSRDKMLIFTIDNSIDKSNSKNIHQVRKRLQSNLQLWRNQSLENQRNQQTQQKCDNQQGQSQHTIIGLGDNINDSNSNKQGFKQLGTRKNLYIGYRKFFHPLYHVIGKQHKFSSTQSHKLPPVQMQQQKRCQVGDIHIQQLSKIKQ